MLGKAKSLKIESWILIIIIVASFLRLWRLDQVPVSMFGDELDVGYHAYSIAKTGRDYSGNLMPIHFQSLAEWRTPLFLYAAVPTVAIFGITPWGVRLPAAFFGIIGVWAMYALTKELLLRSKLKSKEIEAVSILSAAVLAFSPWHIQYSRAAFEVTMLLSFYLYGLFYFFKSIRKVDGKSAKTVKKFSWKGFEERNEKTAGGQYLWIAVIHLVLTPLIYSSAKLFTPMLMAFLLIVWWREIFSLSKKHLTWAIVAGFLVGLPVAYGTLYSGGTQRWGYISVFTDPTRETEIGVQRELAARFRGETGIGLEPTIVDKVFYNKFTFWGNRIINNYLAPFSSEFLFTRGDVNLRHSIEGVGQFYRVEIIALILGLIFFFGYTFRSKGRETRDSRVASASQNDNRVKLFIAFWVLAGVIPSAITRDGGRHATRLILILPPLVFLISYGLFVIGNKFKGRFGKLVGLVYLGLWVISFVFYQKNYWTENPWYSERWWHAGYREAIQSVKEIDSNYETVLITDKNEPPWTFFGAYYNYDPTRWQDVKPDANWVDTREYGRVTMIDKFIFASPKGQLYDWGKEIDSSVLFLASEKEVGIDLLKEPERTPSDLTLLKSISYPSGLPAFYLFTGK